MACLLSVCSLALSNGVETAPAGDEWLFILNGDTMTVAGAAAAWSGLDPSERGQYLSLDDPVGAFVTALARNRMVLLETARLGYSDAPGTLAFRDAWMRRDAQMWMQDSLARRNDSLLAQDDIDYFLARFGKLVWITVAPGLPGEVVDGPVHLPELPREIACHLDSMEAGQVLAGPGGTVFKLDSVFVPDPEMLASALSDTAAAVEYARTRMITVRTARTISAIADSLLSGSGGGLAIRTPAVERFVAMLQGRGEYLPGDTLLESGEGSITALQMRSEMLTYGSGMSVLAPDAHWVEQTARSMSVEGAMLDYLSARHARAYDLARLDAGRRAAEYAADLLYDDSVRSGVSVGEETIAMDYMAIAERPAVPETRSLRVALVPPSLLRECKTALLSGTFDSMADTLGFWPEWSEDDPPARTTRPLRREELPAGADSVFGLAPSDTLSWVGPFELFDGTSVLYRLVRVFPTHEASLDEMRSGLIQAAQEREEEARAVDWMQAMERRYGLAMNREALAGLPSDPGEWPGAPGREPSP